MAKKKSIRRKRVYSNRGRGSLPNEYCRTKLCEVRPDLFELKFQQNIGEAMQIDRGVERPRNYIVKTHRLDNVWPVFVEVEGVQTRIPHRVIEAMLAHRASIERQQRHDRAIERAEKVKEPRAQGWLADRVEEMDRVLALTAI